MYGKALITDHTWTRKRPLLIFNFWTIPVSFYAKSQNIRRLLRVRSPLRLLVSYEVQCRNRDSTRFDRKETEGGPEDRSSGPIPRGAFRVFSRTQREGTAFARRSVKITAAENRPQLGGSARLKIAA